MKLSYKIILHSFFHASGAIIYILLLSWFMINAGNYLAIDVVGSEFLGPAFFLIFFVFSAGVMTVSFFLKPILLFLEGKKKEGLWFLGLTPAWFIFIAAVMFLILSLISSQSPPHFIDYE